MARDLCIQRGRSKVRHGGLIVLDDTHWEVVNECSKLLLDWDVARIRGFKRRSGEVDETSFFMKP